MTCPNEFVLLHAASPLLARKLYKFNFCPADYIHPSRRSAFDGGMLHEGVWDASRARAALSVHILRCLNIENTACFDLSHSEWPLVLLQPAQLVRLQRHLAAVLFNPLIRHSVRHDEVMTWRARLGVDAYKFALHGFNLLPRKICLQFGEDASQLDVASYGVIAAAMAPASEHIRLRALLKLPDIPKSAEIDVDGARRLVNTLMSILEPEWRSYFPATRH